MKTIELTQGRVAIVDDDDYEYLNKFAWRVKSYKGLSYAVRNHLVDGKRVSQGMHRLILNACNGHYVDHINHNTLDNRKFNLRIVNASENSRNMLIPSTNNSGFCGVRKERNKWRAQIKVKGKKIHIGCFDSFDEAKKERIKANIKYGFHENHGKRICEI